MIAGMDIDDANFERVKEEAEEVYRSIGSVVCPYFGEAEPISFNEKGIRHTKFKKDKVARMRADQFIRLKNIHLVQRILEKSRTLQEYNEKKVFEEVKASGRREKKLLTARYYGFIAIVNDSGRQKRLRIVVKQVEGGQKYFWSIIPFWKSNKELKMYAGDMEED